ncbi:hypothetical protein GCM10022198_25360 [Klugiella xanthotipulae]|uniref:TadE-like protein n=1 Tax=Klugiella xanthotipulae TaxID=244735 RepID=A0A543HYZ6_9MICO|nr:hypothetical protein FB466_1840 [Klugiella xanthotipulae]
MEFALVLPAIIAVLGICLAALGVMISQLRVTDAAADIARMLARDEGGGAVHARLAQAGSGTTLTRSDEGEFVCVTLGRTMSLGPLHLPAVTATARSCALAG